MAIKNIRTELKGRSFIPDNITTTLLRLLKRVLDQWTLVRLPCPTPAKLTPVQKPDLMRTGFLLLKEGVKAIPSAASAL